MPIDTSQIQQNSNQMFAIYNQSQQRTNDLNEKVAVLNTETKVRAQADSFRGKAIDMVV